MRIQHYSLFLLVLLFTVWSCAEKKEEPDPNRRKSPIAIAKVTHNNTYIKIVYGQPYRRGRTIFGDIVPYGEVWRTGANEATEITTTKDILVNGKRLEAGTYSLFSIPRPERWTIIFNSNLGQWGAFDYSRDQDVLRVDLLPFNTGEMTEAFSITFDEVKKDSTAFVIEWENKIVRVPVEFNTGQFSPTS